MKTAIQTNGATTYFTKTIDVKTPQGLTAQLSLTRKVIKVTSEDHKTNTTYSITYKGKNVSSYNLNHKSEVKYFLNFLDNYAERIASSSY
jgi:hypothetical protein